MGAGDDERGAAAMVPSPQQRVYVIDDDAGIRDCVRTLVQSVGLPAEVHASAKDFLDAVDPRAVAGCLILDVRLRG